MHPPMPIAEILSAIGARLNEDTDVSSTGAGAMASARALYSAVRVGQSAHGGAGWILTVASLLVLVALGGVAARAARRLVVRSTPELTVLLNQSAAFYRRWPEHRLAAAPRAELTAEAVRCRRIVELLERRTVAGIDDGPAARGPIDGLQVWIKLLYKRIEDHADLPSGAARVH
jgi:hypothetical protein